jgi:hypothetical protein
MSFAVMRAGSSLLSVVVTSSVRHGAWRVFVQGGGNLVSRPIRGLCAGGMLSDDSPGFYNGGCMFNGPVACAGLKNLIRKMHNTEKIMTAPQ